jgi:hypothetical protein
MAKSFVFTAPVSCNEFENLISQKAREQGIYLRYRKGYLVLRKPKYFFQDFPVNFQASFVGKYYATENGTCIEGHFGGPKQFYQLYITVCILMLLFFLTSAYFTNHSIINLLPGVLILIIGAGIFLKVYTWFCIRVFPKENQAALDFIQAVVAESKV